MESMNNFVETNSLVTRCSWKSSRGELEGEAFLEDIMALKSSDKYEGPSPTFI